MARIYYTTSSTALSSFTGNTNYNEKVSLTFTPNANKTYAIFWSAVVSGSSITNFNNVRLQKTTGTAATFQQFEIDRDDLIEEMSVTDFALYTAPASPIQESFAVEGRTSVGTDTIFLSDTHITALELTVDDIFTSASASTSTDSNTYSSVNSIEVGAGDWYVLASAGVNVNTATIGSRGLIGVRIHDGTNTYMEHDSWYSENAANWTPYWGIASVSPASTTTYNLQFRDNSAGTTSLRYRKLLALKKSGFFESFYAVDESLTTQGATEATKLTLSATPTQTGNTLVLSTWAIEPPAEVSTQAFTNFRKDGTSVFTYAGELLLEGQSLYDLFQEGFAKVYNLNPSTVSWTLRYRSTSGTFPVGMKNAAILMLNLDDTATPPSRRIRFVNTDSTLGGNGTTNETTGASRAYASLSEAINSEKVIDSNLVIDDELLEIRCSGTTVADTGSVTLLDWTTSPRNHIRITSGSSSQKATSPWDNNRYRLSVSASRVLTTYVNVVVDGLQIENTSPTSADTIVVFDAVAGVTTTIVNNYIRTVNSSTIIAAPPESGSVYVVNNLLSGSSLSNYGVYCVGNAAVLPKTSFYVYNNTIVGFEFEHIILDFDAADDTAIVKNNLLYRGNGSAEFTFRAVNTSGSQIYESNASSDSRAPANTSNGGTLRNRTFTFVNQSSGDYHLTTTDVGAKGLGQNLSADQIYSFNTDFDLTSRATIWDIGAFQVTVDVLPPNFVNIFQSPFGSVFRLSQQQIGPFVVGSQ